MRVRHQETDDEEEAGRNVEMMWLTARLVPDHKTIADFRKDNGRAIRKVCTRFVGLCREMGVLAAASVAIDGSKFKAVNNRDRNFTRAKMARRRAQTEASVARYLQQLHTADRQEPFEALATKITGLREKIAKLRDEMRRLARHRHADETFRTVLASALMTSRVLACFDVPDTDRSAIRTPGGQPARGRGMNPRAITMTRKRAPLGASSLERSQRLR
jgi:hypothetical protein